MSFVAQRKYLKTVLTNYQYMPNSFLGFIITEVMTYKIDILHSDTE